MKIAERIKFIICDSVRMEINNKLSMIGVYGRTLQTNKLMSVIPQLGVAIMLEGIKVDFTKVVIKYFNPKGDMRVESTLKCNIKSGKTNNHNFVSHFSPFILEAVATAKFVVYFYNKDKILNKNDPFIQKFDIKLGPSK